MTGYKVGQRVKFRVDVDATVTTEGANRLDVQVNRMETGPNEGQFIVFWTEANIDRLGMSVSAKDVELRAPDNWPPQVGDIWEAAGREYFMRSSLSSQRLMAIPEEGDDIREMDRLKALNPVLVRRRDK